MRVPVTLDRQLSEITPELTLHTRPDNLQVRTAHSRHSLRSSTRQRKMLKNTGNLRAVQLLLGHTKMDSTVRYLGVELEDALVIAGGYAVSLQPCTTNLKSSVFHGCDCLGVLEGNRDTGDCCIAAVKAR